MTKAAKSGLVQWNEGEMSAWAIFEGPLNPWPPDLKKLAPIGFAVGYNINVFV